MRKNKAGAVYAELDEEEIGILDQASSDRCQTKTAIIRSLIRSLATADESQQKPTDATDKEQASLVGRLILKQTNLLGKQDITPWLCDSLAAEAEQEVAVAVRLRAMANRLLAEYNELVELAERLERGVQA